MLAHRRPTAGLGPASAMVKVRESRIPLGQTCRYHLTCRSVYQEGSSAARGPRHTTRERKERADRDADSEPKRPASN